MTPHINKYALRSPRRKKFQIAVIQLHFDPSIVAFRSIRSFNPRLNYLSGQLW
jgi:hypothetical protein